jgi:hypothetical protein
MANLPVNKTTHPFDKARFEALLNRRFFYAPSFEIYGGEFIVIISFPSASCQCHATGLSISFNHDICPQASPACTTTAHRARPCRRTSSRNGESTSSSRSTCSRLTQLL